MSYRHHVFVSYCWKARNPNPRSDFRRWVCEYFVRILSDKLIANLRDTGKQPVFVDNQCKTGRDYRDTIAEGHRCSTVLVAVLDAQYFDSKWCRAEWEAFHNRERDASLEDGLIYPIRLGDGDHFIQDATRRSPRDLSNYNVLYDWDHPSPGFVRFQEEVQSIAVEIVDLMRQAPPWNEDWRALTYPEDDGGSDPPIGMPSWRGNR
jgi:hypothetical protein